MPTHFLDRIVQDVTEQFYANPEYHELLQAVMHSGHRLEHRVIPGPVVDGVMRFTVQVRDGGPTVGER